MLILYSGTTAVLVFLGAFLFFLKSSLLRPSPPASRRRTHKTTATASSTRTASAQITADKLLYHQLQNAETFPEALPRGRERLLTLLDRTVAAATAAAPSASGILSLPPRFDHSALEAFLRRADADTDAQFQAYIARRRSGGEREMLLDAAHARFWLRQAAPVKYVDGAWLGGVHRASTAPEHRAVTRTAWQILTEELGDGEIELNHVRVYEDLVKAAGLDLGRGDDARFVEAANNPNHDARIWEAAVSQLCVSLYPEEFLPELLGFNMAYESSAYCMLVAAQELRELKLDATYFLLHIAIDNGDMGHAAMGAHAVAELLAATPPGPEQNQLWRRVQAGYILAEGLPTTPTPPSPTTLSVAAMWGRKAPWARPSHAVCRANIGGKTLGEWLDPAVYPQHSHDFLTAMAASRWVAPGDPDASKLLRELRWGGRMFGAFTPSEIATVSQWIAELVPDVPADTPGAYAAFTGHTPDRRLAAPDAPVLPQLQLRTFAAPPRTLAALLATPQCHIPARRLAPLLIATAVPFERLPSHPVKCATPRGMAAVKALRALHGFGDAPRQCAGMDEVLRRDDAGGVVELGVRLGGRERRDHLADWVRGWSVAPERYYSLLVGVQLGLAVNVLLNLENTIDEKGVSALDAGERRKVREIGERVVSAMAEVVDGCRWKQVCAGFFTVRCEISMCTVDAGGGVEEEGVWAQMEQGAVEVEIESC
ncbi:ATPase-like protein [Geopyxis carbonaria]|nr:ATPase-like protein [Geopyxis carbonaria]